MPPALKKLKKASTWAKLQAAEQVVERFVHARQWASTQLSQTTPVTDPVTSEAEERLAAALRTPHPQRSTEQLITITAWLDCVRFSTAVQNAKVDMDLLVSSLLY